MGIHTKQSMLGAAQNQVVMMHQATSDGSNHLVQWLEPSLSTNLSPGQPGGEQEVASPVVAPLIAYEITGPPDGMVKPEFEIMLRKGDVVYDARFMCWE
eukprot:14784483-Heterocapsa_arctica.AAC.1